MIGVDFGLMTQAVRQRAPAGPVGPSYTDFSYLDGTLEARETFSRTTVGTYIDAGGLRQSAGVDVPRFDHDPVSLAQRGLLLEPFRVNLLLNSTVPATQTVAVSIGTDYVLSVSGAGSADISGVGSATQGAPLAFTAATASLDVTVVGSLDAFQLEAGQAPSSLIETLGTSESRDADYLSADISDILDPAAGSVYFDVEGMPPNGSNESLFGIGFSTNDRLTCFRRGSDGFLVVRADIGGVAGVKAYNHSGPFKLAIGGDATGLSISFNGGATQALHAGTWASVLASVMYIGRNQFGFGAAGHLAVRSWRYYPSRLSDGDLQVLTT